MRTECKINEYCNTNQPFDVSSDIAGTLRRTGDSHIDIQPGDIFLWRTESGGHVGVVKEYRNDEVIIIEAISSSGSREESKNREKCKGCVRESKYTRLGNALRGHDGWQGYFRPIINTK